MARPHIPHHRPAILPALGAGVMLATAFGAGLLWPVMQPRATYQLIAETRAGHVYIAGAGSTCREASKGAVIPDDWTRLTCERSRFSASR